MLKTMLALSVDLLIFTVLFLFFPLGHRLISLDIIAYLLLVLDLRILRLCFSFHWRFFNLGGLQLRVTCYNNDISFVRKWLLLPICFCLFVFVFFCLFVFLLRIGCINNVITISRFVLESAC